MPDQSCYKPQEQSATTKKSEEPHKTVSFKCSISDLMAMDAAAKKMGMTRSGWLAAVIREALHKS